jgi:hypothetical protein
MGYLGTKPANSPLTSELIPDGIISTSDIADGAITTAKIGNGAIVQADLATGVAGTGPAFSATQSTATSCANGTLTKILFQTEEFDTNSNYDTSTSRFTPTVAGYYQVNCGVYFAGLTSQYGFSAFYKNGSLFKYGNTFGATAGGCTVNNSCLIYMNGSTDYLEVYATQLIGFSLNTLADPTLTYFQASMVRAA